jgi:peptide/nickel transport system permease protein
MKLVRRFAGRAGQSLVTLAVVTILVFVLVRLTPGDPVKQILGDQATPQSIAALRQQLGLNNPPLVQFLHYVQGLFRGDLGQSIAQNKSVVSIIASSLPITLALIVLAMAMAAVAGTSVGILAGTSRRRGVDATVRLGTMLLYATPTFLIGLILILVFAVRLKVFPAGGWGPGWPANLTYLWLPAIALAAQITPAIARTVRQAAIGASNQQFMEAAFSRGLSPRVLTWRHVLPNSLLPVVTLLGVSLGGMFTGAIIVEAVFGLPGIGGQMVTAVSSRDYPVIQGIALVTAAAVLLGNFIAEVVYTVIDPRTRVS